LSTKHELFNPIYIINHIKRKSDYPMCSCLWASINGWCFQSVSSQKGRNVHIITESPTHAGHRQHLTRQRERYLWGTKIPLKTKIPLAKTITIFCFIFIFYPWVNQLMHNCFNLITCFVRSYLVSTSLFSTNSFLF